MLDVYKAAVLRNFTAREAELNAAVPDRDHSWRWADGVILFPEARCPYCSAHIRSNRIWKALDGILHGQWKIVPPRSTVHGQPVNGSVGQLVKERPNHPHVSGGGICMGSATTEAQALFMALNPQSAYDDNWYPWLRDMFDHVCYRAEEGDDGDDSDCDCEDCQLERGELVRCGNRECWEIYDPEGDPHGEWCEWCEGDYCPEHIHALRNCAACSNRADMNVTLERDGFAPEQTLCERCVEQGTPPEEASYCNYFFSGHRNGTDAEDSSCYSRHIDQHAAEDAENGEEAE